jgi:hypothetical protein
MDPRLVKSQTTNERAAIGDLPRAFIVTVRFSKSVR